MNVSDVNMKRVSFGTLRKKSVYSSEREKERQAYR